MKYKIILIALLIITNISVHAKPKIVTSITPLASLIAMLTGDEAEIVAINVTAGCPHHYQMKPSDKTSLENAKILIYIDDNFDSFAVKLSGEFTGKIIKISDFSSINFRTHSGEINWHFWLDLNNVLALHEQMAKVLIQEFPEFKSTIELNKNKAQRKIEDLIEFKNKELAPLENIVVISDSFEHFFVDSPDNITKLYQKNHSSLKDYSILEQTLSNQTPHCLILDANQDDSVYRKFNKKIIKLESENWANNGEKVNMPLADLFYIKYNEMITQLKGCQAGE